MSNLSLVAQTLFDAEVKAAYASNGFLLRDGFRMKRDIVGKTVQFRKVGQIISVPTGFMQAVTIQDPGYNAVETILQKYTTPTGVDEVEELEVNFDVRMENAMLVSEAMGRRSDQICIDALAADPGSTLVDGGTNFNYTKFTQVMEFFEDNAVPLSDRYIALSASNVRSLMADDQFVSSYYTDKRVIDKGIAREYLGFNLVTIPTMVEGGLPKAGTIRNSFAWHKKAVGMGVGKNFQTRMDYIPEKNTYLINGLFSATAKVIDNAGVIQINCDESV